MCGGAMQSQGMPSQYGENPLMRRPYYGMSNMAMRQPLNIGNGMSVRNMYSQKAGKPMPPIGLPTPPNLPPPAPVPAPAPTPQAPAPTPQNPAPVPTPAPRPVPQPSPYPGWQMPNYTPGPTAGFIPLVTAKYLGRADQYPIPEGMNPDYFDAFTNKWGTY